MKWNVGTKIAAGFGLAIVIFVIVGAVAYRSTTELVAASELRKQEYEVLSYFNKTLLLLQDVELGQRSYALVGEEPYLQPYNDAVGRLGPMILELRKQIAGNAQLEADLNRLEPLIRNRLEFAAESIDLRRNQGAEAALRHIRNGTGKALTEWRPPWKASSRPARRTWRARHNWRPPRAISTSSASASSTWSAATRLSEKAETCPG